MFQLFLWITKIYIYFTQIVLDNIDIKMACVVVVCIHIFSQLNSFSGFNQFMGIYYELIESEV